MMTIHPHPALFEGAVGYDANERGIQPVRLPVERSPLFVAPDDVLMNRARSGSGVRLRFATNSSPIELAFEPIDAVGAGAADGQAVDEPRVVDLTCGAEVIASRVVPSGTGRVVFEPAGLPDDHPTARGLPVYEVWLHQFHPTRVRSLGIEDGSDFAVPADPRPRWTTYGSSITMCRTAASPARTWPATAARALGLNLTSLGFGGQCHLDAMVARVIRDLPADIITLKLGINVYGGGTLNARSYPAAVIALIAIVRERHPRTPIGVITPIISPDRENTENAVALTLEDYRAMTRDAVERLRLVGDRYLHLFEGTDLFGSDDVSMLPDGIHPSAAGYELIGRRVADTVLPGLLAAREMA